MSRILVLDIETAPIVAFVWDLKDQNIGLSQIHEDWSVLAWAAKWEAEAPSKMIYMDNRDAKNVRDDRELLKPLWKLLDEADIVITQNGKAFDGPKLNARFILHGMKPPSPYKHLDTYLIVKSVAKFTSNKLEYLTDKLCTKYKKLTHGKFPGMSLWKECLKGNTDAWDEMKKYNIHDVLSTEELYNIVKAWAPKNTPKPYNPTQAVLQCRTCGVTGKLQKRGVMWKSKTQVQRLQCTACGAWDTTSLPKKEAA
jgi:DNA polymerase elongation subunit (family B)